MPTEQVALSGAIYAREGTLINDSEYEIGEFRGGANLEWDQDVITWRGQRRVTKSAVIVRTDMILRISEVAFHPQELGDVYNIIPTEKAALKRVNAIVAGGTEATVTTEPGSDESFEDNEQVVVADETGWLFEGYIDGAPTDTTVKIDDGAGAAISNIEDVGVMAGLDYTSPQYLTRADNALLDIGNAEDYSVLIRFKRRREGAMEVLVVKTSDADGTAYGTTAGWVLYVDSENILHFAVNDGVDAYIINGTTPILKDEMVFVAATFDESAAANCKVYLAGYDDTASRTGTLADIGDCSNALAFSIGAESDGGLPYDGYIVEVAVYSDAVLTAANILAYASAPRVEPGSPDAWWPFTGAAADTTIDDEATAANSLDLTLVGGTTTNYGTWGRDQIAIVTANLLGFNWDMEPANIGGWTAGDVASELKKDTQYLKYGGRTLRVKNTDATQAFARATVTTIADVEYHFHGWFRAPVTPNGASQLVNVDATPALGVTVTQAGATTGGTWYEVEFDFEAADTSTTIDLGSGSVTDAEMGYWDDIQLMKNYVDAGDFETNIAGSDWVTTGAPTVDDADASERTGAACYKINSDDPVTKYVSQAVTLTSGEDYTFAGHVKCGTAEKGVIVLSGAASQTLDNGLETSDWVKVRYRFTAASGTLTIKIYGDGQDARFDDFSVTKVDFREWHVDDLLDRPEVEFMLQYVDSNAKINQFYLSKSKMGLGPIVLTNKDVVVEDLEVMVLDGHKLLVEN